ncbi:hypothetical protein PISMIDRAFT_371539 [Pisolithus microcarpus 441]|uniref:Unplaced genomic scaffold scaffold_286, whole genome shotgun sequence n=1 Tax=Pisolithus microcarpus 441 TaxID=765257 RepID=A0A0C9YAG7_9AGAM|nr:hypothetical protein PISMIDRAFT_371539 [Pisolithus microcarpus 441]
MYLMKAATVSEDLSPSTLPPSAIHASSWTPSQHAARWLGSLDRTVLLHAWTRPPPPWSEIVVVLIDLICAQGREPIDREFAMAHCTGEGGVSLCDDVLFHNPVRCGTTHKVGEVCPRRALHIGICRRFTNLFAKLAGRGSTEEVSSEATN